MALPKLETPTYELIQPSTGKKIRYRPFLVKEHKVLLTMSETSDDEVIRIVKELVNVCTFNQLKIDDVPHFDIEYIFMMLRAKSIGEKVDVVVTCVNCNEKYDSSFNIEDITIEKKEKITDKIMITDTIGMQLKYPTFANVVKIFETEDLKVVFNLVKSCIKGIFDSDNFYDIREQTDEEINEFLESLTKEQFAKIEQFFVDSPKIVQKLESDCPHCKHRNFSRLQGLQNFFV
jgi:uncharacterized protein YfkK (UPF0435 family)